MTFADLAKAACARLVRGGGTRITSVASDSRRACPGACFVAIRGYETDGHRFIGDAIEHGASAVIYEDEAYAASIPAATGAARAADSRKACAGAAAALWAHPSEDLTLAAVTGTNGKTTTVLLIEALMAGQGHATGTIGTLGHTTGRSRTTLAHTTPESVDLQALFAELRDSGVTHVAMEASSHALSLHRVWATKFDVVCFTNLSQDHMDFYATMDEYLDAKALLFTEYARMAAPRKVLRAALNIDDSAGREIRRCTSCPAVTYGIESTEADVRATDITFSVGGTDFVLTTQDDRQPVRLGLVGRFNVYNALAASAAGVALGYPLADIARGLEGVGVVPGRFEVIDEGQDYIVACDYAHTPDGLVNVLRAARQLTEGRLLCLFGCGGDRDRTKRPLMAQAVCETADVTIVTSDNPRSEEPLAIIADIEAGLREDLSDVHIEPDRRRAIELAVSLCKPGDVLMICGKGHEDYQQFADRRIHFDDREEARRALRARLGTAIE